MDSDRVAVFLALLSEVLMGGDSNDCYDELLIDSYFTLVLLCRFRSCICAIHLPFTRP